ncbi:MAG: metallophosphoesterase family protein [Desulfosarcina sp.]|nr:metallophosphoesterase family protein [Desulfobacterales bacterium]
MKFTKQMVLFGTLILLPTMHGKVLANDLPVKVPAGETHECCVRNPYSFEEMHNIVVPSSDGKGLLVDLGDDSLSGVIYTGQYPFEAGESDYDYARYRTSMPLTDGAGTVRIDKFFSDKYNANSWPQGQGNVGTMTIGYRLDLGADLGFYDSIVSFSGDADSGFSKELTIVEGPFITKVKSDETGKAVIAFETDEECDGRVELSRPYSSHHKNNKRFRSRKEFTCSATKNHEIELTGLKADMKYYYRVWAGASTHSSVYSFKTAPKAGTGNVKIAFASDSREGQGGGERNYMGMNFDVMSGFANDAYRKGADLFIFGGDLINGYTSNVEDFRLQLRAWKQAMAGFWRSRPVYPAMGNHETLMNFYDDAGLDKWPYETQSAEAIFAEQFWNPENGPATSDPRRPTYRENLYSFQYGTVLCIAFNNNYWYTQNDKVPEYGGSPEGYMMEDQLEWVEGVLADAESNSDIRYILLYAQEPVFPCGGHVKDAMWWRGDNNIKAYEYDGENVNPAGEGIVEVRNRFWKAIAQSSKVAAVLAGDEHCYHRLLVDSSTPVGVYPQDDVEGNDGVLDQYSPNPEFINPTWHITAGTAGAPYYAREDTPWSPVVFSSQTGYCLIEATNDKISLSFYSISGQKVDYVDDLMAVKN